MPVCLLCCCVDEAAFVVVVDEEGFWRFVSEDVASGFGRTSTIRYQQVPSLGEGDERGYHSSTGSHLKVS